MKVKLLTGLSGLSGSWAPGDDYECDKEEAKRFVDAGIAEYIQPKTTKKKTTRKAKK